MQTRIVVPSLHHRRAKLCRQRLLKKRNVFVHQLLLQVLGAGGDDDARAAAARRGDRGNEISERLAGPRSRFDDQMMLLLKRAQHGFGHVDLAGPMFVLRMSFGDQAIRAED